MPKQKLYHVYVLINPLKPSKESYIGGASLYNIEPFYFGYTYREERLDEHLDCRKTDKNKHKKNTIKKIRRNGLEPIFIKILETIDEQTAKNKEIEMIAYYGRADKGLGPLTNMTDGGDGGDTISNHPNKEEIINKITGVNNHGYGKKWYNNGEINRCFVENQQPDNWIKGFLLRGEIHHNYETKWYNNSKEQGMFKKGQEPEYWTEGKLLNKGILHPNHGGRWYNNGKEEKLFDKESKLTEDWILGRLQTKNNHPSFGKKYYNNGTIDKRFLEGNQPKRWELGRIKQGKQSNPCRSFIGMKWYNNGIEEGRFKEATQPEDWVAGRMKRK